MKEPNSDIYMVYTKKGRTFKIPPMQIVLTGVSA